MPIFPLPTEDGIIADKQKAYEAAQLERKQREKMKTLQDFGFTLGDQQEAAELELIPESEEPQNPGGSAYRGWQFIRQGFRRCLPEYQPAVKYILRNAQRR